MFLNDFIYLKFILVDILLFLFKIFFFEKTVLAGFRTIDIHYNSIQNFKIVGQYLILNSLIMNHLINVYRIEYVVVSEFWNLT